MAEEEVFCFCLRPQPKTILCVINMNFYADAKGTGFRLSGGSVFMNFYYGLGINKKSSLWNLCQVGFYAGC